ncbi:MYND finger family protein [Trichuris trichiura]|uniref:MYND finger family protein n=1 Tax=Trichuris trichiura TaxID=36087 RepID=A0A077Z4B9_TRITR|nr:MYND finger family protein [Trichuris trichiura]
MKTNPFVRSIPPEVVRQLWALVKNIHNSCGVVTLEDIVGKAEKTFGWTREDTEAYVKECADCRLLVRNADSVKNAYCYSIPMEAEEVNENDWYCFNCHQAGDLQKCTTCFRSFHTNCLPADFSPAGMDLLCPSCQAGSKLMTIPGPDSSVNEVQYRLLVAHPMDLGRISDKLETGQYSNVREFLSDVEIILHNVNVVFGKDSSMVKTAQSALEEVKATITSWETGSSVDGAQKETADVPMTGKRNIPSAPDGMDGRSNASVVNMEALTLQTTALGDRPTGPVKYDFIDQLTCHPLMSINVAKGSGGKCNCAQRWKQYIISLAEQWQMMFKDDLEKCYTELRERQKKKLATELAKLRAEMMEDFRRELDSTREELNARYAHQLKFELQKLKDRHRKQLDEIKKKQWCYQCESEAIYYCCWNTSYCSVECQQEHWETHRATCRRKKTTVEQLIFFNFFFQRTFLSELNVPLRDWLPSKGSFIIQ